MSAAKGSTTDTVSDEKVEEMFKAVGVGNECTVYYVENNVYSNETGTLESYDIKARTCTVKVSGVDKVFNMNVMTAFGKNIKHEDKSIRFRDYLSVLN